MKSSVCGNLAEDDCISVESSTSSCDIVEEDDIVAEEDQEVEASFASLMNKVVDKISDTFQGGPKVRREVGVNYPPSMRCNWLT